MDVFGDTDDVNLIFRSFFDTLSVLVDKHVPLKNYPKEKRNYYLNRGLQKVFEFL